MAAGINKAIILGYAGKDPYVSDNNGLLMVKFSLATSNKYKDKNTGQLIESTEWHNIVCFDKTAAIAQKVVKKGNRIFVEGSIKTRKYLHNNIEKYTTEIIAKVLIAIESVHHNNENSIEIEF